MLKEYPWIFDWKYRLRMALLIGGMVAMINILLQPFDTYLSTIDYKNLKLAGYGVTISISYCIFILIEVTAMRIPGSKWTIIHEAVGMVLLSCILIPASYVYHHFFLNGEALSLHNFILFSSTFALPFIPVIIPPVLYFRYRWGDVRITEKESSDQLLKIQNEKGELLITFESNSFFLAEAQQNYVSLYSKDKEKGLNKDLIRITLNDLEQQIDAGIRVHRSYLVNLEFVKAIKGNKRKSFLTLEGIDFPVPVSPQKYSSLKELIERKQLKD